VTGHQVLENDAWSWVEGELTKLLVAVWNGQPARGPGGTADAVAFARGLGRRVVHVNPAARATAWLP